MNQIVILVAALSVGCFANFNNTDDGFCSAHMHPKGCKTAGLKYSDDDVDMSDYIIPDNLDISQIVEKITKGDGWFHIPGVFSAKDAEMARERILAHTHAEEYLEQALDHHTDQDELHNKFNGLVWALFNKGKIFEKMAQHPVILNISNNVLGEKSQISSLAANTVLPGKPGQLPHLDYPYYRGFYPSTNPNIMDSAPPLAVQFVTLLTEFNKDNGGTALRPHSHHQPRYPEDKEDFFNNAIQVEGKAGDVVVFAGALQHCAMPNRSKMIRAGILQHMAPVYIKPFENMAEYVRADIKERATPEFRRLLALDHPYPILKA